MLNVAYVMIELTAYQQLLNKVIKKVQILNKQGLNARAIFVTYNGNYFFENESIFDIVKVKSKNNNNAIISSKQVLEKSAQKHKVLYKVEEFLRNWFDFRFLIREYKVYNRLKSFIDANEQLEKIIIRYPLSSLGLLRLVKKFGYKIIFEHNTLEVEEVSLDRFNSLGAAYQYFCEKYIAKLVLNKVAGIIAVTDEISNYESKRANRKLKSITIGNGIDVAEIPVRTIPFYNKKDINILFLVSEMYVWHGLDRLLNSLVEYKGNIRYHIHIVGELPILYQALIEELKSKTNHTLINRGYLQKKELDSMFNTCHIACACLAVWRKGLHETSALKVRDYLARGIPFIIGEYDKDLDSSFIKQFTYVVGNNNDLINMGSVADFCDKVFANSEHSIAMNLYAKNYVDYDKKIQKLANFLKTF